MTLKQGNYQAVIEFTVPQLYPKQKCEIELKSHNFNEVFANIFMMQVDAIIRRLWNGGDPGYEPGNEVDINEGKVGYRKALGAT